MRKTIPRLVYSMLGRRVYIVLRYRLSKVVGRKVLMIASEKYDVTDDFLTVLKDWRKDKNSIDQHPRKASRP